jgi:sugar/nucleoside kinase (ribokinase family)
VRVLLVGEINLDIILKGGNAVPEAGREVLVSDSAMTLGSSCAITGAGMVRLGHQAAYFGRVGADTPGRLCLEWMVGFGLDISRVKPEAGLKTGITVSIASRGDRSLVSYPGATISLHAADIPRSVFEGFDHLHSSSYFLQTGMHPGFEDVYRRAKGRGMTTSLDPACDPAGEWKSDLDRVLPYVDVFLPNEVELEGITGEQDPVRGLRALANGRTLTVVKLGSLGAMALAGGEPVRVTAPQVEVVDPTGAGDCFNAGFLHGWLAKRPLQDSLELGVGCGSFSIRALGGTGAQPTEAEVRAMLAESRAKEAFGL